MSVLADATIAELLESIARRSTEYLEHIHERSVGAETSIASVRELLPGSLQDGPRDPLEVVMQLADLGDISTVATVGPRYFGFVTGGTLPAALGAELLGAAWDQNGAMAVMSPLASVAEEVAARWLLELLDLPAGSSVGFVTGGQGANSTCLAVASQHVLSKHDWDVQRLGLYGAPRIQVLVGAERHTTIDVSIRLNGLGAPTAIIPADGEGRMLPDPLAAALKDLDGPVIVCAQAGNVNSGAFDPFTEIADLCRRHDAWLHVDGAFGLWAAASSEHRHLLEGVRQADSWSTDGHKWLNVPYDCGYAITRHPQSHHDTFASDASYYVLGGADSPRDGMDLVPEASRRARGLATWAAIRSLGRHGVSDLIGRCCTLAVRMGEKLAGEPGVEILNEIVINQVLVRFGDDDDHTLAVIEAVKKEGTCWAGGSRWQGRAVMRISVSNWSTTAADIDRSADAISRIHRELMLS
jgi:glutamate/tyrosine decarboxylase-like PLP-dependent enzyme